MSKEPTEMNLYQKLLEIQKQIVGLGKDKAAYGYKYVTGDKVLEHLKPLMNKHGIILKQEILSIENERQDYQVKNGPKSEILSKLMMRFTWIDCATGEKDENLFGANGQNDWDKGVGSALTYAERYFLLKFFHIATDEDDIDNPERKPQEQQPNNNQVPAKAQKQAENAPIEKATKAQKDKIAELLNHEVIEKKEKVQGVNKIPNLNIQSAEVAINYYTKLIAERSKQPS